MLVFSLKIYPFILKVKKDFFINEIYDFAQSVDKSYNSFIKYFKKSWENSKFLEFDILPNGNIYNRINNLIKSFHHKLNNVIEYNHPRISILLDKLKDFQFIIIINMLVNFLMNLIIIFIRLIYLMIFIILWKNF